MNRFITAIAKNKNLQKHVYLSDFMFSGNLNWKFDADFSCDFDTDLRNFDFVSL